MITTKLGTLFTLAAIAAVAPAASTGWGQGTPSLLPTSKVIRLVVPGPPGGPAGTTAQMFAAKLGELLKETAIVEYKPGAGGNIAMEYVSRSAPDGYTLFFAVPALVTNPYFQKVSFDPSLLVPVIQINSGPFLLLVNPNDGYKSAADVIAAVRAQPGAVTCAAGSVALSTVSCHLLQSYAGPMLLVAYPGNAQAAAALQRGEIKVLFDFMSSAGAAVREGRLQAVAVTSRLKEDSDFKEIPPIEQTIPGFDLIGWQGIMVPKDTSRDTVMRLNAAFNQVLRDDDVRRFYQSNSIENAGGTPDDFAARIKHDLEFYGRIAREAKIEPQ
jgi:tripartite-type tricarboxylate transporter receptor subunit TctC